MSILIKNYNEGGELISYKQIEKKKRVTKNKLPLFMSLGVNTAIDLVDSITLRLYDVSSIDSVYRVINAKYDDASRLQDYKVCFYKMDNTINDNQESHAFKFALKNQWDEVRAGHFFDVAFIYSESLLIATITHHHNGHIAIKMDGLKQYDDNRSELRREFLYRLMSQYSTSGGQIMRLHLSRDEYGLLTDEPYINLGTEGCIYHKSSRNNLVKDMTRFERTINICDIHFKDGHELLRKIIKSYRRHLVTK